MLKELILVLLLIIVEERSPQTLAKPAILRTTRKKIMKDSPN